MTPTMNHTLENVISEQLGHYVISFVHNCLMDNSSSVY